MRIAIIGTGISGNTAAWLLHEEHDLVIFEANDYIGGHTNTVDVKEDGQTLPVDTGFIVFNDWTYPNFIKLLDRLGVPSQESSMSFSVHDERSRLEYNGTSLNALFAQRSNLVRPSFLLMVRDILRFNREAAQDAESGSMEGITLGEYLRAKSYSTRFVENYIIPMGAAIWSAEPKQFLRIPFRFFVRFFRNHGMLNVSDRPQWRVIKGGSREYVKKLTAPFRHSIRLNTPVQSVRRFEDRVEVTPLRGEPEAFDHVVIAAHSDQALAMLADPTSAERRILRAIPYQANRTLLHTDISSLPDRKLAWAAWNYRVPKQRQRGAAVTYNMNILQSLHARNTYCVSLNWEHRISSDKVLRDFIYHHPVYTQAGVEAQSAYKEISGVNRTSYCGAYWGNGFHEDGVKSAIAACEPLGGRL